MNLKSKQADCHISYDGSFEGFLSVVFSIYQHKWSPISISADGMALDMFADRNIVVTSKENALRVAKGIAAKGGKSSVLGFIYQCFLSERSGIEIRLLYLIQKVLSGNGYIIADFSDAIIVDLHKIRKMIGREVHRMHAFVRFQETKDYIWACAIQPDFNVLPLIGKHFKARYPAQHWLIYDTKRHYGIYYEIGGQIEYVDFQDVRKRGGLISSEAITEEELQYQAMWQQYFKSVNIPERNNPKLHLRHVPKRYWQYLIEKKEI